MLFCDIIKKTGGIHMSKSYSDEFKRKIAELRLNGKPTSEIVKEYSLTKTSVNMWAKQYINSGKFTVKENLSESEKELRLLRKENKQLKMEVDILKQAALILARKPE